MTQGPRPSRLVLTCAAMLAAPAFALAACGSLALALMAVDPHATPDASALAWLGAILCPAPAALLVLAEYRAISRGDAKAAALVAFLCLWFPVAGTIGWVEGVLCLAGVLPRGSEWGSWADLGIYSAFLLYMAFAGLGHLHWWRVLRASKAVGAIDGDA